MESFEGPLFRVVSLHGFRLESCCVGDLQGEAQGGNGKERVN